MTDQHPTTADEDVETTAGPGLFARLTDELAELGFDSTVNDRTGFTTFIATDSPVRIALDTSDENPRAVLVRERNGDADGWEVTVTATLPEPAQLVVLYAILNPDDPTTAIHAAAAALDITTA